MSHFPEGTVERVDEIKGSFFTRRVEHYYTINGVQVSGQSTGTIPELETRINFQHGCS